MSHVLAVLHMFSLLPFAHLLPVHNISRLALYHSYRNIYLKHERKYNNNVLGVDKKINDGFKELHMNFVNANRVVVRRNYRQDDWVFDSIFFVGIFANLYYSALVYII